MLGKVFKDADTFPTPETKNHGQYVQISERKGAGRQHCPGRNNKEE